MANPAIAHRLLHGGDPPANDFDRLLRLDASHAASLRPGAVTARHVIGQTLTDANVGHGFSTGVTISNSNPAISGDWGFGQFTEIYLHFPTVNIPSGARIISATLAWTTTPPNGVAQAAFLRAEKVADASAPSPSYPPQDWPASTSEISIASQNTTAEEPVSVDVTALLNEVLPVGNYDFVAGNSVNFAIRPESQTAGKVYTISKLAPVTLSVVYDDSRPAREGSDLIGSGKIAWVHTFDAHDLRAETDAFRSISARREYRVPIRDYQKKSPDWQVASDVPAHVREIADSRSFTEVGSPDLLRAVWGGVPLGSFNPALNFTRGWNVDAVNNCYLMFGTQQYDGGADSRFYLIVDLLSDDGFVIHMEQGALSPTTKGGSGATSGNGMSYRFQQGTASLGAAAHEQLAWESTATNRNTAGEYVSAYIMWVPAEQALYWGFDPGNGTWDSGGPVAYAGVTTGSDPFSVVSGFRWDAGSRYCMHCMLEFTSKPADHLAGCQWMAREAQKGNKAIYPGWRA
ncbi:MAG: hypothetical protein D6744_02835 [Planctomycetota bacterium]|nr:MAG: hypothetical protein D6744_02835 [Planctomycetota bacterium]